MVWLVRRVGIVSEVVRHIACVRTGSVKRCVAVRGHGRHRDAAHRVTSARGGGRGPFVVSK